MHVVEFQPSHLWSIVRVAHGKGYDVTAMRELRIGVHMVGPGLTFYEENRIMAVVGITELWPGVCEAWLMVADGIETHTFHFYRRLRKELDKLMERKHRVQASVETDNRKGLRLLEKLGFLPEGVMVKYSPDQTDHLRYARVK